MKINSTFINNINRNHDYLLFTAIITLALFGSVMVISSSSFIAEFEFGYNNFFVDKQIKNFIVGIIAFIIGMSINYRFYNKKIFMYPLYAVTIIILAYLLFSNAGTSINGAKRWIFGFQPSELAKISIIFVLAFSLNASREKIKELLKGYSLNMFILASVSALVVMQPSFSAGMLIFGIGYFMLGISGMRMSHLFLITGIVFLPIILVFALTADYRIDRLKSFTNPSKDVMGKSYQVNQGIMSLGNGGITGVGIGESRQKEFYLPEPHNDFIFSIIGDELGFIGTISLIGIYIFIILRGFKIARNSVDYYGFMLASGITFLVALHTVSHLAINTGLFPNTGVTLPLVSYGGTSLMFTMFCLGVLLNISYKSKTDGNKS